MRKATQNLLLVMIGVALLHITVISGDYVNYVRPAFQIMLIGAAAVIVLLGVVGFWIETRDLDHDDGDRRAEQENHHGARAPRTAWLLFLPILGIFLVAPPALGSFTASRAADAIAMQVIVRGAPMPPKDAWVQVTGMWRPPATTTTRTVFQPIMASSVRRIPKPPNTYE